MIVERLPEDSAALRAALYAGTVFLAPPTDASLRTAATARARLADVLGDPDVREAPARMDNAELFARIGVFRRELYLDHAWHAAVRDVVAASGLDPARVAFDPLRLRVVLHRGHELPAAAPVYHPHRDTWYAHPQCLIAWWIPLDDLAPDETFVFHPDFFAAPVGNDSEVFDYDDWVRDGWELNHARGLGAPNVDNRSRGSSLRDYVRPP